MIEVNNLSKKFGDFSALKNISFSVKKGQIVGFLGPNGAGKTTTMRIITGYLSATSGKVLINNLDVCQNSQETRKLIGYIPEDNPLYPEMKVYEYLFFLARIRNLRDRTSKMVKKAVLTCNLENVLTRQIGELSKGFKQRVGLAGALLHDPDILILDEPTTGLDPNQIVEIRNLIKKLGRDKTVILSTHILPEVQATCEKAIIINEGKIVAQGTVDELTKKARGKNILEVKIKGPKEKIEAEINKIFGISEIKSQSENQICSFEIETEGDTDIREPIFKLCVENNWILLEQTTKVLSLEEIFRRLTIKE